MGKFSSWRYYNRGDETKRNKNFGLFKKNMARCFYVWDKTGMGHRLNIKMCLIN